jgi:hypothetical protein
MKYSIIFLLIGLASWAAADSTLQGYSSPNAAVVAFLNPLRQGLAGVPDAIAALSGTDQVSPSPTPSSAVNLLIANSSTAAMKANPTNNPLSSNLNQIIRAEGNLMSYRLTDQQNRLGGKMVKMSYNLYFSKGPMKEITFTVMQPTMTGGYHVMDTQISIPAPNPSPSN